MRSLLCVLLLSSGATSFAQRTQGTYRTLDGVQASWSIGDGNALIWEGKPYSPIGAAISGSPERIEAVHGAGVTDVAVDLPANGVGWDEAFQSLQKNDLRYLIRVNSLAPMAKGVAVDPAAYRVAEVVGPRHLDLPLPGASEALVVVALKRDGSILATDRRPVVNGHLVYDVKTVAELETVVLIYPVTTSLEQPDFWEGLDEERDRLLTTLRHHAPGKGLRAIINPLGRLVALPGKTPHFVPTSPAFRAEFRNLLEQRYRNVETAVRAWSMSGSFITSYAIDSPEGKKREPIGTFDDLARLVPLWSGTRGVPQLWDSTANQVYPCDSRQSTIWKDLRDAIQAAEERRFSRLVTAIRSVTDVPVLQEWEGWSPPYDGAGAVVDGIGIQVEGSTPSELLPTTSRAASSLLRWNKPGWLAATDVSLGQAEGTSATVNGVLDDLKSIGARGVFIRTTDPKVLTLVAGQNSQRGSDAVGALSDTRAVFFPENATNPATAQRLTLGKWWLPSPADGNRIDLGREFFAYRTISGGAQTFAIWSRTPRRVLLRMLKADGVKVETIDGSDPQPKATKNGLEINLSELPVVLSGTDEVPVPMPSYLETVAEFEQMVKVAQGLRRDTSEPSLIFSQAVAGFDRNPGGNFAKMREQYDRLVLTLADYTWIEGESPKETNFSEFSQDPGCSGGASLSLRSQFPQASGFHASYPFLVRSGEDQEVWIAAKLAREDRGAIALEIGGQTLTITGEPLSPYGDGFAWYRLGTTKLRSGITTIQVSVAPKAGLQFSLDTLLLTPHSFTPNGVRLPDPIPFGVKPSK